MKTTKKDFELFKSFCDGHIKRLGLVEWSVHYNHGYIDGSYAETGYKLSGGVATITLSKHWDDLRPKTDEHINRLALHEVLHIVMAPLFAEAGERYTNQMALETAEHLIIRRLENVLV